MKLQPASMMYLNKSVAQVSDSRNGATTAATRIQSRDSLEHPKTNLSMSTLFHNNNDYSCKDLIPAAKHVFKVLKRPVTSMQVRTAAYINVESETEYSERGPQIMYVAKRYSANEYLKSVIDEAKKLKFA